MLNLFINSPWTIEIVGTIVGALIAFSLAYWFDLTQRNKRLVNQLRAVQAEIILNNQSIVQIRSGYKAGFTLDRLQSNATEGVLSNSDFFREYNNDFMIKLLDYRKSVFIANQMIDLCFLNWPTWLNDQELKTKNIESLETKFKSVEILSAKVDCYLPK